MKMIKRSTETQSSEFAESIINTVREPLVVLDQDLRVISASRSFYEIFKVNPGEIIGQLIYDLGNKQWDIPRLRELLETILPQKTTFENYEVVHDFATIGKRIMLLNARQIQRVLGKERIILLAIEDITKRKRAEETFRESERKLREAQTMAQLGHWDWDIKSGKVVWSGEVYKIFQIDPENFTPNIDSILALSPWPEDHKRDKELIRKAMESREKGSYEQRFLRPDKSIGYYDSTFQGKYDDYGNLVSIVGTVQDTTQRKRLERKLNEYNIQLEQKSRDLEQIIYVTSHDLRSPLVNVQGFSKELLRSIQDLTEAINTFDFPPKVLRKIGPILKQDIPESLGFIQSSIAQMDIQLSALLKLSRIGRAAINIETIDMNTTIAGIVKSMGYSIQQKSVQIEVSDLPSCMADAAQTNQIFLNLIGNAVKYLDPKRPGIITISGSNRENFAVYCIEDNGIGIAEEYQAKIFEISYRIEQAKHSGEGLGLTIVRQCAEKQNGTVWVESKPGKGSSFFVKLPSVII
jgi:PAS domain S-box-containing protein